jgi:hypothetical protein
MMQRIVRTMPYARRTWTECFASFALRTGRALPGATVRTLRQHRSLKHRDACALMSILSERRWTPPPRIDPPELTGSYAQLVTEITSASE